MINALLTHARRWKTACTLLSLLALGAVGRAQFYAPDTYRHDPVQRVYPVELARVLAWLENQKGGRQIAEITFSTQPPPHIPRVTTRTKAGEAPVVTVHERSHTWTLRWLDADGQPLRQINLRYSDTDLEAGAGFYRGILAQFRSQGVAPALSAPASAPATDPVYDGLAALDTNRLLTLKHAAVNDSDPSAMPDTAAARRLAGQLLATASFGLGGQQTLDTTLAARAAAWLALSETGSAPDAPWAVLLALNHRTRQARDHWKNPAGENASPTWWSILIEKTFTPELALAATRLERPPHALPLFAAAARQKISATLYGDFLKAAYENQPQALLSAYDQAPWLYQSGNIETGHLTHGAWTLAARRDWLNALIRYPADKRVPTLTDELLATALNAQKYSSGSLDLSVAGLKECAPILRIALERARGPLTPVAALTFDDLLHHGWETQALHLVTRHLFLSKRYGDRELGARYKAILDSAGAELASMAVVDDEGATKPVPSPAHDLLSRLEAAGTLRDALVRLESDTTRRREGFYVLQRSFWLSPANTYSAITLGAAAFTNSRTGYTYNSARDYIEFLSETGNVELCRRALSLVNSERSIARGKITDEDIAQLTRHLAPEDSLWTTLNRRTLDAMPEHERARTLETYYWNDPSETLGKGVYQAYIAAHDLAAAQRFYDQVRTHFGGSVAFSNQLGPARLMRAILDEDAAGLQTALLDSDTGSAASLTCEMMAAVNERDPSALKKIVETSLNRYPPRQTSPDQTAALNDRRRLLEFMPLWPALADPRHRDHAKALDHFGPTRDWPSLRWLVAERLNLSTEDRIRFFGGEAATGEFRLFIACLRRDTAAFEKLYADLGPPSKRQVQIMSHVLIHQLRADLLQLQPPPAYNLAPPEPKQTLQQQLAAAYAEKNIAALRRRLEKFATADALWKHISDKKWETATSRPELAAALALFVEKFPESAHYWNARLLLAQVDLARVSHTGQRKLIDEALRTLREIAQSPAAPLTIRGSAAFTAATRDPFTPDRGLAALRAWIAAYPDHESRALAHLILGLLVQETEPAAALAAFIVAEESSDQALTGAARIHRARLELMDRPIELRFTTLDGSALDLTQMRGKVVLIDFWATWCAPCIAELPSLTALYEKHHRAGFEIIGISQDRDRATLEEFLKTNGLKWPQVHEILGAKDSTATRYGVFSYPTKWLVDRHGRVRLLRQDADLDAAIQTALDAK